MGLVSLLSLCAALGGPAYRQSQGEGYAGGDEIQGKGTSFTFRSRPSSLRFFTAPLCAEITLEGGGLPRSSRHGLHGTFVVDQIAERARPSTNWPYTF